MSGGAGRGEGRLEGESKIKKIDGCERLRHPVQGRAGQGGLHRTPSRVSAMRDELYMRLLGSSVVGTNELGVTFLKQLAFCQRKSPPHGSARRRPPLLRAKYGAQSLA